MSLKIVFSGKEYDGVDAMPPDVRKEYEVALESLRKSGGEEILTVLQRGPGAGAGIEPRHSLPRAPMVDVDEASRTPLWRVIMWVAAGCIAAWWLFHRG